MRSLILDYWIRIKSSYWFVPALMCCAATVLAFVAVTNSELLPSEWIEEFSWLYANDPEGARSLLATVAGSMITVAGVVFSMTLLMVSHASAQIGPRVVEGFMRDRGSQVVLGTFIATFIYCLLVLRSIQSDVDGTASEADAFVPDLAIVIAVILALLSVAVLIYFIHHVPARIAVNNVIDRITGAAIEQLQSIFPERTVADSMGSVGDIDLGAPCQRVTLEGLGGYLRLIDYEGLLSHAQENDCVLEVLALPGKFHVRGAPLALVYLKPLEEATLDDIQRAFSWGGSRTQEQDILFLVDQLAEISGRALSPGVNDQFTAIACIDHMSKLLREACERGSAASQRHDDQDTLRLLTKPVTLTAMASHFLYPLRQFADGDAMVTTRLIEFVSDSIQFAAAHDDLKHALEQHLHELKTDAIAAIDSESLRSAVVRRTAVAKSA